MYEDKQIQNLAKSLDLTLNDFTFLMSLSGILFGFTLLIVTLLIVTNSDFKG